MSRNTRFVAAAAGAALMFSLAACSSERETETGGGDGGGDAEETMIGIAMPTRSLERWINDGAQLEELLGEAGYETSLQYADNKVEQQITQIETMVNQGVDVLVVAAIDAASLGPALDTASEAGIDVISYDRLILGTDAVDYYATFDNYEVGKLQGEYIVEQLDLENAAGPFNLEPFAGDPGDNNAKFFFSGAWDVLKPYIDSGKLVVPSGKAPATNDDWTSIGITAWESSGAQDEMDTRINSFYGDKKVDVVLSPNDSLALGIQQSLESAGYTPGADWPLITGQDADEANVLAMLADKQSMTVWKDTRTLGAQTAKMIDQMLSGETVEVNDEETYDNGNGVVPTYLLPPEVVTKDTVEDKLVGSGFYDAETLGL